MGSNSVQDLIDEIEETTDFKILKSINDQSVLAEFALAWVNPDLTAKVLDQSLLEKIALTALNPEVRITAIQNLSDEECLGRIGLEEKHPDVRMAAIKKLSDQFVLAQIVKNETNEELWVMAVNKITDEPLLMKMILEYSFKYDKQLDAWEHEERKAQDKSRYENALLDDEIKDFVDPDEFDSSIYHTEEELSGGDYEPPTYSHSTYCSEVLIEKLTDQELLEKIVIEVEDDYIRELAIKKLTNRALLEKILLENGSCQDGLSYLVRNRLSELNGEIVRHPQVWTFEE